MSLHRFFVTAPLPAGETAGWQVPLQAEDLHHLIRVLRLEPGDEVVLAGTDAREAGAVLRSVDPVDGVLADVGTPRTPRPLPRVALAQGLARRERMELAVQKATELGATEVLPVAFARSVVRLDEERSVSRVERWQRIAAEAAKQSQRSDIPIVRAPVDLAGLIAATDRFDAVIVPWEEAAGRAMGAGLREAAAGPGSSVLVVIGPEGGMEPREVGALVEAGAVTVTLGPDVLRTDTAAVVALALASYELGGMGRDGGDRE